MAWLPLFNCNADEVLRSGSPGNLFVAVFAGFEPFLFPPSPFRAAQARRRVPWPPPFFAIRLPISASFRHSSRGASRLDERLFPVISGTCRLRTDHPYSGQEQSTGAGVNRQARLIVK
jgi:hypothetical protein